MSKSKVKISKYAIIAEALGDSSTNIGNYITGIMSKYNSDKLQKITKASELYDKRLEEFKEQIKKEIQEIE